MIGDIPRAVWHEIMTRDPLSRRPEQELVMDAEDTVKDYSDCGSEGGALFGPYLFNAAQISMRVRAGDLVVDLGCGSGRLLNMVAEWLPEVRFIGVDLSTNMLSEAWAEARSKGLQNVSYVEGDFSTLSKIDTAAADAVISSMALHHLPDRAALTRCFDAINRVLRPGGAVYVMDFGRLRSIQALEIFVAKVAASETAALAQDYRASLHAAFKPEDFQNEIERIGRGEIKFYKTFFAPLVMIAATAPVTTQMQPVMRSKYDAAMAKLSHRRRAELLQLQVFLRFGGIGSPQ